MKFKACKNQSQKIEDNSLSQQHHSKHTEVFMCHSDKVIWLFGSVCHQELDIHGQRPVRQRYQWCRSSTSLHFSVRCLGSCWVLLKSETQTKARTWVCFPSISVNFWLQSTSERSPLLHHFHHTSAKAVRNLSSPTQKARRTEQVLETDKD